MTKTPSKTRKARRVKPAPSLAQRIAHLVSMQTGMDLLSMIEEEVAKTPEVTVGVEVKGGVVQEVACSVPFTYVLTDYDGDVSEEDVAAYNALPFQG